MKEIAFAAFSLFTLLTAAGVVLSRNVIYSAFNLVMCFFGLAVLYLLWGANFIAMIQVLIYAGAIVVLFVFVVMLLNFEKPTEVPTRPMVMLLIGGGVWVLSLVFLRVFSHVFGALPMPEIHESSVREISKLLFTQYLWPFEILTVFLLALIIGIFLLARPQKEEGAS